MYVVRKKFKFEMAHRLISSLSKSCQNYHGHSYILEVFFKSDTLNKDGMVIDFGEIKERLKQLVDDFDHALVLNEKDPVLKLFDQCLTKIVKVNYNPTAECMTKDFYDRIKYLIMNFGNVQLVKVRLHETDTGFAEYSE